MSIHDKYYSADGEILDWEVPGFCEQDAKYALGSENVISIRFMYQGWSYLMWMDLEAAQDGKPLNTVVSELCPDGGRIWTSIWGDVVIVLDRGA